MTQLVTRTSIIRGFSEMKTGINERGVCGWGMIKRRKKYGKYGREREREIKFEVNMISCG